MYRDGGLHPSVDRGIYLLNEVEMGNAHEEEIEQKRRGWSMGHLDSELEMERR